MTLTSILALGGIILAVILFGYKKNISQAKQVGELEVQQKVTEQLAQAKQEADEALEKEEQDVVQIRDRLRTDDDYADGVRRKFTRPD